MFCSFSDKKQHQESQIATAESSKASENLQGKGLIEYKEPQFDESVSLLPPILSKSTDIVTKSDDVFNAPVFKNDTNDVFDESRLLGFVPKSKRKQAQELLKLFDKYASEITWNSSGIIYIEQVAIPNSNIFITFPYLFKASVPKNLPGFKELVQKIVDLGFGHLISFKHSKTNKIAQVPPTNLNLPNEENVPWWYLGP